MVNHFDTIPDEMVASIFRHVPLADRLRLNAVCRRFRAVALDPAAQPHRPTASVVVIGDERSGSTTLAGAVAWSMMHETQRATHNVALSHDDALPEFRRVFDPLPTLKRSVPTAADSPTTTTATTTSTSTAVAPTPAAAAITAGGTSPIVAVPTAVGTVTVLPAGGAHTTTASTTTPAPATACPATTTTSTVTKKLARVAVRLAGRDVIITNTPSKTRYSREMARAVAQEVDVLVLVVAAGEALSRRVEEALTIAVVFRVAHLVVVVNKMDEVNFAQDVFEQQRAAVQALIRRWKFEGSVRVIPASARFYVNVGGVVHARHALAQWYRSYSDTGDHSRVGTDDEHFAPTVVDVIRDAVRALPAARAQTRRPLQLAVERAVRVPGVGTVVQAHVIAGSLHKTGSVEVQRPVTTTTRWGTVTTSKQSVRVEVRSIQHAITREDVDECVAGEFVGIALKNASPKDFKRGMFLSSTLAAVAPVRYLRARVVVSDHGGEMVPGRWEGLLHVDTIEAVVRLVRIEKIVRRSEENVARTAHLAAQRLFVTDVAEVILEARAGDALVIESSVAADGTRRAGRAGHFIVRATDRTILAGRVLATFDHDPPVPTAAVAAAAGGTARR